LGFHSVYQEEMPVPGLPRLSRRLPGEHLQYNRAHSIENQPSPR